MAGGFLQGVGKTHEGDSSDRTDSVKGSVGLDNHLPAPGPVGDEQSLAILDLSEERGEIHRQAIPQNECHVADARMPTQGLLESEESIEAVS